MHDVAISLLDKIDRYPRRPGPPSRLDVHQRKLEHDKMYLHSFEVEMLSQPRLDIRAAQQRAELDILRSNRATRIDRIRLQVSNSLMKIANSIRPSDARRRDIASAR
jgi:hypothetical protein